MQERTQQRMPPRRVRRPEKLTEAHARGDRDLQALVSRLQAKVYEEQQGRTPEQTRVAVVEDDADDGSAVTSS